MKKIITFSIAALMGAASVSGEVTADFTPKVTRCFFQELVKDEALVSQVMIQVQYPSDVYWVKGCSGYCSVVDREGNNVDWTPDFSGPSGDYSLFYYGINGLDKYLDMDYTLIIPEGIFGDSEWESSDHSSGRCNPEIRYDFNVWKLAGEPYVDNATYNLQPVLEGMEVVAVSASAKEYRVYLLFPESVAIHKYIDSMCSIWDGEDNYMSSAKILWSVDKNNPNRVVAAVRYLSYTSDTNYTLSIAKGAIGTTKWGEEHFSEDLASPEMCFTLNPVNKKMPAYDFKPVEQHWGWREEQTEASLKYVMSAETRFASDVYSVMEGVAPFARLVDKDGNDVEWHTVFNQHDQWYSFGVGVADDTDSNDYTLIIPAGVMGNEAWSKNVQEGSTNPELRFTFNPSKFAGVEQTEMSEVENNGEIYNLQGIRVNIDRLPAGVYISNGRKFIVR